LLVDTRQHWMAALRYALRPILLAILGGVLLLLVIALNLPDFLETILWWATIIVVIIAVIWLPIDLVRWRSRRYLLTSRRAIRAEGVIRKNTADASLEKINEIGLEQGLIGRTVGYADLTLYTASDQENEAYEQLIDGLQFKKAVLDAKEALRKGTPLMALAEGFVVKGGTNEASRRADGKLEAPSAPAPAPVPEAPSAPASTPEPEEATPPDDEPTA